MPKRMICITSLLLSILGIALSLTVGIMFSSAMYVGAGLNFYAGFVVLPSFLALAASIFLFYRLKAGGWMLLASGVLGSFGYGVSIATVLPISYIILAVLAIRIDPGTEEGCP